MIPVPQVNELQQIPKDFLPFDAALAARPPRAPLRRRPAPAPARPAAGSRG